MNRGAAAETLAASYLAACGLTIEMLVFVEVRLRCNRAFGSAAESITAAKRRRLRLAARHYLARLGHEPPCRFDAVLLDALATANIEWLRGIEGI